MPGYDQELVERLREQLAGERGVTERVMFGGVAFMLDGNMCVGAMKGGDLMVRLATADEPAALLEPHTRQMNFTGRPMVGWILVAPSGFATDADLAGWVSRGVQHVRTLPPKHK
ncbi:MAG: TfoX/Sxy family protein [Candidatus Nanopelagicales bacterium]